MIEKGARPVHLLDVLQQDGQIGIAVGRIQMLGVDGQYRRVLVMIEKLTVTRYGCMIYGVESLFSWTWR